MHDISAGSFEPVFCQQVELPCLSCPPATHRSGTTAQSPDASKATRPLSPVCVWPFEVIVSRNLKTGDDWLWPGHAMISKPEIPYGPNVAYHEGCPASEILNNCCGLHSPQQETGNGPGVFNASMPQGPADLYAGGRAQEQMWKRRRKLAAKHWTHVAEDIDENRRKEFRLPIVYKQ